MLLNSIESYTKFSSVVNEELGVRLFSKLSEEGYISEMENVRSLAKAFVDMNEKCSCQKKDAKELEEDDEDENEDDEEDED